MTGQTINFSELFNIVKVYFMHLLNFVHLPAGDYLRGLFRMIMLSLGFL